MAKPDRRKERTERALRSAFVELVLSKGYDNVTVEDIVARADVGRSTFYMHYTGREALLRHALSHPSAGLLALIERKVSAEELLPLLAHFHEQRAINRVFFADPIRRIWVARLAELIEPRLAAMSRAGRARPLLPLGLIAMEIAEAQIALVSNWLTGRAAPRPPAVAEALVALTDGLVAALVQPERERLAQ